MIKAASSTIPPRFLDGAKGLRIIGDVHGAYSEFAAATSDALASDYRIVSIGDIVDRGDDNAGAIRHILDLHRQGVLELVPGNHDWRFARWAVGRDVKINHGLDITIAHIAAAPDGKQLRKRFADLVLDSALFHRVGCFILVHAAFSQAMLWTDPPRLRDEVAIRRAKAIKSRALYGQTEGWYTGSGELPKRIYEWIDDVPADRVVVIGHDYLHDEVREVVGAKGGRVVYIDTGSGKGGRLSWLDIPLNALNEPTAWRIGRV